MKTTLFYDKYADDPVAAAILANRGTLDVDAFAIDELTSSPVSCGVGGTPWRVGDRTLDTGSSLLVNRFVRIRRESLEAYGADVDVYRAFKYTTAFLSFLIDEFTLRTGGPGMSCLAGNYSPLNNQWFRVAQSSVPVPVPEFEYTFGFNDGGVSLDRAVQADPNDFRALVGGSSSSSGSAWHRFVFSAPTGRPLACAAFGPQLLMSYVDSEEELAPDLQQRVARLVEELAPLFGVSLAEFLLFEHDGELSFGCFNHEFLWSRSFVGFDQFVLESLKGSISQVEG